jgi:hypothetical protein
VGQEAASYYRLRFPGRANQHTRAKRLRALATPIDPLDPVRAAMPTCSRAPVVANPLRSSSHTTPVINLRNQRVTNPRAAAAASDPKRTFFVTAPKLN